MNKGLWIFTAAAVLFLGGCETAQKVTTGTGKVIGEGANVVGGVAEGGAEAVKGKEDNPYNR